MSLQPSTSSTTPGIESITPNTENTIDISTTGSTGSDHLLTTGLGLTVFGIGLGLTIATIQCIKNHCPRLCSEVVMNEEIELGAPLPDIIVSNRVNPEEEYDHSPDIIVSHQPIPEE